MNLSRLSLLVAGLFVFFISCSKKETDVAVTPSPQLPGKDTPIVAVKSGMNQITFFSIDSSRGVIDTVNHTVLIKVSYGLDPTQLKAYNGTSDNSTVVPANGAVLDFTNPVTYTVTAENGNKQEWKVTVERIKGSDTNVYGFSATTFDGTHGFGRVDSATGAIKVGFNIGQVTGRLSQSTINIFLQKGSTVSPASGTVVDMTQPFVFTVTAENGDTKQYTAKVYNTASDFFFQVAGITPHTYPATYRTDQVPVYFYKEDLVGLDYYIGMFSVLETDDISNVTLNTVYLPTGARMIPDPSVPQNFNKDVKYSVITEIGDTVPYTIRCVKRKVATMGDVNNGGYLTINGSTELYYLSNSDAVDGWLVHETTSVEYHVSMSSSTVAPNGYKLITFTPDVTLPNVGTV